MLYMLKNKINTLIGAILLKLIPNSRTAYNFSKKIINRYNNNKNFDPNTNGEFRLISIFLKKKKKLVFFDVGSNKLEFFNFLQKHDFKGMIVLIDAIKFHYNFPKNTNLKIIALTTLVSDKKREADFYIDKKNKNSGTNSMFNMNKIGYKSNVIKKIKLNSNTLDSIAKNLRIKKIDYLKIDIEGAEFKALKGAKILLEKNLIENIHLEYGHAAMADRVYIKDIHDYLKNYGFKMYIIKPYNIERVYYTPYIENEFDYINLFFSKK